jgi:hypothetical protein
MIKTILLALLAVLGGCATIREHPVIASIAVALVAGSIAASQNHDNRATPRAAATIGNPNCAAGTCQ